MPRATYAESVHTKPVAPHLRTHCAAVTTAVSSARLMVCGIPARASQQMGRPCVAEMTDHPARRRSGSGSILQEPSVKMCTSSPGFAKNSKYSPVIGRACSKVLTCRKRGLRGVEGALARNAALHARIEAPQDVDHEHGGVHCKIGNGERLYQASHSKGLSCTQSHRMHRLGGTDST